MHIETCVENILSALGPLWADHGRHRRSQVGEQGRDVQEPLERTPLRDRRGVTRVAVLIPKTFPGAPRTNPRAA
jgi:hypothetical protein